MPGLRVGGEGRERHEEAYGIDLDRKRLGLQKEVRVTERGQGKRERGQGKRERGEGYGCP